MINKNELKRLGETIVEFANHFDAQAKFNCELKKPGVREFFMNDCRIAATPEKFQELERRFKLHNMSIEAIDEFTEKVIEGINKMFVAYDNPQLTTKELQVIRNVIRKYFNSQLDDNVWI